MPEKHFQIYVVRTVQRYGTIILYNVDYNNRLAMCLSPYIFVHSLWFPVKLSIPIQLVFMCAMLCENLFNSTSSLRYCQQEKLYIDDNCVVIVVILAYPRTWVHSSYMFHDSHNLLVFKHSYTICHEKIIKKAQHYKKKVAAFNYAFIVGVRAGAWSTIIFQCINWKFVYRLLCLERKNEAFQLI